ncbi:hypothetical protein BDF19DRAFT_425449 [Syncephalis fuscata]|nr:hypothetical protein BDF19DRAFT_425449 [Syncephalis fuscata]
MQLSLFYQRSIIALLYGVVFVLATPQQTASNTSPAAQQPTLGAGCVSCPKQTACDSVCGPDEVCVLTIQSCTKCPTAKCQTSMTLSRNAQSSSSVAAIIAGLVWYRQKRRNKDTQPRYGAQLNATGVYAGSRHNMSGFKSPYAASRQTGFSEDNRSVMDDNERFSMSRPPTAWGGFQAAAGATEALADITSMTIESGTAHMAVPMSDVPAETEGSARYMAASLDSHNAYEYHGATGSNPSLNSQHNAPTMTLGAMVAAATAAVSRNMDADTSYNGRMMTVKDSRQNHRISVAESSRTDMSEQTEVTMARKTTLKQGQSATFVDNVEHFITPTGQISRSATISDRSYHRGDHSPPSFDATVQQPGIHDSLFPVSNTANVLDNMKNADYNYRGLLADDEYDLGWPRTSFAQNVFSSLPESTTIGSNMTPSAMQAGGLTQAMASTRGMRPESDLDPSNALYNLARAVADEEAQSIPLPEMKYHQRQISTDTPRSMVDVTIQLPDAIRAVMEANEYDDMESTNKIHQQE